MSDTHTPPVGDLEARVDAFEDPATLAPAEQDELGTALVALANAYGRRGEFDAEADTIDRLETLAADIERGDEHLASALVNATAVTERSGLYETGVDLERLDAYRERLQSLAAEAETDEVAAALAEATAQLAHAAGKAEAPERIPDLVGELVDLATEYEGEPFAAALALGHAYAERYVDGAGDRLERVEALYDEYPTDDVADGLAGVIAGRTNADAPEDLAAIEDRIARIQALDQQHPDAGIRRWLPIATTNATRASFEAAAYDRLEHWGNETLDVHEALETPTSASWAAAALFYSARGSFFEGDVGKGERKLERLEDLQARYENPVFDHWLARSMFDAARSYAETGHYEQAREVADELAAYAEGHEEQAQIEAGLESLREQAPGLFGEPEMAAGDQTAEAVETTAVDQPEGDAGDPETIAVEGVEPVTDGRATDEPETITVDATEAVERAAAAQESEDNPGCGSCGPDGCGSCGTGGRTTVEPAGETTLVAMGALLTLVTLGVGYAGYRLVNRLR